ncbi:MAG: hypothetical protein ACPHLK_05460 [Gammaproteobacteria bacterium]|jgi:hypothetical protein
MDENAVETLLVGATKLRELQVDSGYEIHEQSTEHFGELLKAHMLAVGTIGTVLSRRESEGAKVAHGLQQQAALISSFIQGINIVDSSISEGHYSQATVLIHNELETIIALEETTQAETVTKEGSKAVIVPKSLTKLYSDFIDIDEKAVHNMLATILSSESTQPQTSTTGLLMAQQFNEKKSWQLFGLHVSLLIVLAIHINEYYQTIYGEEEGLNDIELEALINAEKILVNCGWLTK